MSAGSRFWKPPIPPIDRSWGTPIDRVLGGHRKDYTLPAGDDGWVRLVDVRILFMVKTIWPEAHRDIRPGSYSRFRSPIPGITVNEIIRAALEGSAPPDDEADRVALSRRLEQVLRQDAAEIRAALEALAVLAELEREA